MEKVKPAAIEKFDFDYLYELEKWTFRLFSSGLRRKEQNDLFLFE